MESEIIIVFTTVGSPEEGDRIAAALVEERLAACVNIVGGVKSVYRWKDALTRDDEVLLIIKSSTPLFAELRRRIRGLHSYELPEIVAIPLAAGDEGYLDWVREAVKQPKKD